ncbi:UNVERIFIED_CONTAM: hypothetical protein Slati_1051900 [Sesamum latifolium]|uniref:Maturase K n=1 Tax=Sesamum latifolium TaxID=2727402 RepID=A0AAW2XW14_9LAMI
MKHEGLHLFILSDAADLPNSNNLLVLDFHIYYVLVSLTCSKMLWMLISEIAESDVFFLIELFRYSGFKHLRNYADDPILRNERILSQLRHDILVLENQHPVFILNQLFNMTKTDENPGDDVMITLALRFFDIGMLMNLSVSRVLTRTPIKIIDHLCGLVHDVWCLPFAETISQKSNERDKWENINSITGLRLHVRHALSH